MVQPNQKLVNARLGQHWTQEQLAERLGTSSKTVLRWEKGLALPSLYNLQRLCELFGLTPADLGLPLNLVAPAQAESVLLRDPLIPPMASKAFVGRTVELAQLTQWCVPGARISVTGLPGIGKTSLVTALLQHPDILCRFHGVLWAVLGPQGLPLVALHRWRTLLGEDGPLPPLTDPLAAAEQALRVHLVGTPYLLVLDDVWESVQIAPFLMLAASGTLLITTRSPRLAQQIPLTQVVTLPPLTPTESAALLTQYLPASTPGEQETLVNAAAGLPLAVKIFAQHLAAVRHTDQQRRTREAVGHLTQPLARVQIAALLDDKVQGLAVLPTVQQIVMGSLQTLPPAALALFGSLAILPAQPERFREAAALAVGAVRENTLDMLVDSGLVTPVADGWYQIHQLVHDVAAALPAPDGDPSARLLAYISHLVDEQLATVSFVPPDEALLLAGRRIAHLRQDVVATSACLEGLSHFYLRQGRLAQLRTDWEALEQQAQDAGVSLAQARAMEYLGMTVSLAGDSARALAYYRAALVHYATVPDIPRVIRVHLAVVTGCIRLGHFRDAADELALIQHHLGNQDATLPAMLDQRYITLHLLITSILGEYPAIVARRRELLARLSNRDAHIQAVFILIEILIDQGQYGEAETMLHDHDDLAQDLYYGSGWWRLHAEWDLAQHHPDRALAAFEAGMRLATESGDADNVMHLHLVRLEIAYTVGDEATIATLSSLLLQNSTEHMTTASVHRIRAEAALRRGDHAAAQHEMDASAASLDPDFLLEHAQWEWTQARLAAARGQWEQAYFWGQASLSRFAQMEHALAPIVRAWLAQIPPPRSQQ